MRSNDSISLPLFAVRLISVDSSMGSWHRFKGSMFRVAKVHTISVPKSQAFSLGKDRRYAVLEHSEIAASVVDASRRLGKRNDCHSLANAAVNKLINRREPGQRGGKWKDERILSLCWSRIYRIPRVYYTVSVSLIDNSRNTNQHVQISVTLFGLIAYDPLLFFLC